MATINMLEETANYLLNHCFVLGGVEDQRAKYLYVQDHLDEVRAVFAPLGYSVLLYPAAVFGEKFLYPPAAPRSEVPLRPVETGTLDPEQLQKEQQLLLEYARMAVTEENVALLAQQALAARRQVAASTLADEYPSDFARIIGLHTYSQSPRRDYDIERTGKWVERGGFRFEEFILMPRKEEPHGRNE